MVGDAAADLIDHIPQGRTHRNFHDPGIDDIARQSKDLGTAALFRSVTGKPGPAV